ncbi:hypothetical protein E2C01_061610 [Portunus trituberculatus]|uniref:Uncharacterized protein n=1 Tax=Portunus trituberculatus TaxID=210409 RepID=A0A5B7HCV3_PORTR|nr:hypothetical protein [Portunus trituberculatus]
MVVVVVVVRSFGTMRLFRCGGGGGGAGGGGGRGVKVKASPVMRFLLSVNLSLKPPFYLSI